MDLIAIDPGGTTGFARYTLVQARETDTPMAYFGVMQARQDQVLKYVRGVIMTKISKRAQAILRSMRITDATELAVLMSVARGNAANPDLISPELLQDLTSIDLIILYERFVVQSRTHRLSPQHDAQDFIGAVQALCNKFNIKCFPQNASEAKHLATRERLHALNMWTPSNRHANDATGHILFGLIRFYQKEAATLLRGDRIVVRKNIEN